MLAESRWSLASTPPNQVEDPSQLASFPLDWRCAPVPGTAAEAMRAAGRWDFDRPRDFDDVDWWYRCTFAHDATRDGTALIFEGLATLADVWLNGERILESSNMFERHRVDVRRRLRDENDLLICFRSLNASLAKRRARPRWKTKLVRHQQLRWFRTTLLGRIPGWSPPVACVGPWRPIRFADAALDAADRRLSTRLEGTTGIATFACRVDDRNATGTFAVGDTSAPLRLEPTDDGFRLCGEVRIEDAALWWPHTHGDPALHECVVELSINGEQRSVNCGPIGFRALDVNRDDGAFELRVNGIPVFCRGAGWTPSDIVTLRGAEANYRETLERVRDAGANMIRVGGTMIYEDDAFYRCCDELGILVWQDFMFANMDYPAADATFADSVTREATQLLERLSRHPSVAVYCGNSEVEQQAAMLGMPRDIWRSTLFAELLPSLCARLHPTAEYVPSTPSGGVLPFHTGTGVTHYYGVGAYLRPISDARRANVRFTPECLGFANVPAQGVVDEVMGGDIPATHDPRWKLRTPRDTGAGWDFEDVRDHYLAALFNVDPVRLRSTDTPRYLELSRVASGEVMAAVFAEWRRPRSSCRGALVWFLRDLWPGAGWGILDSHGDPKACYHYLRRAWQPRAVLLTDEGLDGIHAHVVNDSAATLDGSVELTLLRDGTVVVARGTVPCSVAPRSAVTIGADEILGAFLDVSYAYRFGRPGHDVTVAVLRDSAGRIVSEAFHFPVAREPVRGAANVVATLHGEGAAYELTIETDRFLYAMHLDVKGFDTDDDYFHLAPGRSKTVRLRAVDEGSAAPAGFVEAINLADGIPIGVTG